MKAENEWHDEGIFKTLGDECSREAKDKEVRASSLLSKKPVFSEENTCNEHFLVGKEHAIKKDGEVGSFSLLSKKPVSSEEN
eukprot:10046312-Ditylum_brightwellii.AAC.1